MHGLALGLLLTWNILGLNAQETTTSGEVENRLEEIQQERAEIRERLRETRQEAREEAKTRREEYQQQLSELRDQKKQRVVDNLDKRMTAKVQKWVSHWTNVLDRLSQILVKVETRAERLAETGKDISAVTAAVADAAVAIDEAQASLDELAGKDYVFEIDDEATLGEDVRSLLATYKEDLKATWEMVKAAREAVQTAIRTLNSVTPEAAQSGDE